jgi:hypothetical protein
MVALWGSPADKYLWRTTPFSWQLVQLGRACSFISQNSSFYIKEKSCSPWFFSARDASVSEVRLEGKVGYLFVYKVTFC